MKQINLLITGSSGLIYSNFIRNIIKNHSEYKISSIDNIHNIKNINTIYSNKSHQFYLADVCDNHILDRIFEISKPDIVIHGADLNFGSYDELFKTNVTGTKNVIEACVKHKINKFIYTSSDKVYGSLKNDSDPSKKEDSELMSQNVYSSTKIAGELMTGLAHKRHGLNYNILRLCNNYGPRQMRKNLIPSIVANIIEQKEVNIYNKGENQHEWLHVQDTVDAIKTILDKGNDNEIYNITSNSEFSNLEVFNEACNILGKGNDLLKFTPAPNNEYNFRYSMDNTKLKNLGWKPNFKFKGVDGGLAHSINWLENNYHWFLK